MIRDGTIIVSDLHVDTWTDRKLGTGKTKRDHFFHFLDWCEKVGIRELVLNGDLMDLPPWEGQESFREGPSIARDTVERLVELSSRIQITYVPGNHDIGISGFRCMGQYSIRSLRNVNVCYPAYVINEYPESTVLIEHGHFCDPAIMLYVRDLANRTYRASEFERFHWAMQRRYAPTRSALTPIATEPGKNAYYEARKVKQTPDARGLWPKLWEWIKSRGGRAIAPLTAEWWSHAAMEGMTRYIETERSQGRKPKPRLYQIYGHTHRVDPCDPVVRDGVSCTYINAGTWAEQVDQGWYVDIRPDDGTAWLQDWINEPVRLRRLGGP